MATNEYLQTKRRRIEQNKIIGNTIYSIVLGFIIFSVFIENTDIFNDLCTAFYENDLSNFICIYITSIRNIIVIILLIIYFVIDWFSFNVLLELGKRESFRKIFFSISFLIFWGYIIVLTKTQLHENTHIFLWLLWLYFSGTIISYGIGFICKLQRIKAWKKAWKDEPKWVKYDSLLKLVLCVIGGFYLHSFFKVGANVTKIIWFLISILVILLVVKCVRLTSLAKERQKRGKIT
ncbi:MAG: hypothetical protein LBD76_06675 [Prevotellaceae bacterium]|jgi:hypothetical protein|nr:hypothetical protein [Prevotellaceae bacterium]